MFIGSIVNDEYHLFQWLEVDQLTYLEDTTIVLRREAAKVHYYHSIAILQEPRQNHLPGVIVAEEIIYSKAAVLIGFCIHFRTSLVECLRPIDKAARELAGQEVQELMWLQSVRRQVGSGDELDTADVPPMSG